MSEKKPIEQQIADALEIMFDACGRIQDADACRSDGCPIWGYACLQEDSFLEVCDFLNSDGIREFLGFAHSDLDSWHLSTLSEGEYKMEMQARKADIERGDH